ncbi:galactofuranose ABC transporter, permease protein YjfF [Cryptosporangium aurantiacum]|uniref:Monosaccharide ABC transporter membrane protein, CUT2 family n=1 Tax=Cryptosporangium aurantiacum TaxID=134849 RepID=A0A1M7RMM6_9ACTN|nr:galactofuranose ABC transporter, permease protein YjfF [Cryptosporangium aurantiacum]SHN47352.1 monosaccharide ABC transporter membrane protein, CUT2 family [Cryptosporangium aurantiacum]
MTSVTTEPRIDRPKVARARRYGVNSRYVPVLATLVLLCLMYGIGVANYEGFSDTQIVLNIFIDNAHLLTVAIGMTFVILSGGIDLSVGAVLALGTVIAAALLRAGWSPLLVIVVVLAVGALIGLAQGAIIHFFDIQPFIATLAGMFTARGLAHLISTKSIPITDEFWKTTATDRIHFGGFRLSPSAMLAIGIAIVAALALAYTRFGRNTYAVGGNQQSAALMGLPVGRTRIGVYTLSGLCAALGGILYSFETPTGYSLTAQGMELDAIAAVVIGGTLLSGGSGFLVGTVLGVLVLGLIQTIITFQGTLSSWWTKIVIGGLLFAFILLQRIVTRREP